MSHVSQVKAGGRNTGTGAQFEHRIEAVLQRCGLASQSQVLVGDKPGGGRHRVDHVVTRPGGGELLVSCKTQNTGGTAEEKLPFELMKLAHTVSDAPARWGSYAVLVLDGDGWSAGIRQMLEQDAWLWMGDARKYVRVYYSAEDFVKGEFPDRCASEPPLP